MSEKVILIGNGAVGSSYVFACVTQNIAHEIGIIDVNHTKAEGDALDLSHALAYTAPKRIYAATYDDCKYADIVVITAGAAQRPGETRLDLVHRNVAIFKDIIGKLMDSGFDGIIIVASNPVDIITYVVQKLSGLPYHRVIGSGTSLDSARFRYALGHHVGVDPRNVHGYIMGEHGDSEFVVWSHTTIGGQPIFDWVKQHPQLDDEAMVNIFFDVRDAAKIIIEKKGATYYGIAVALARLTKAIFDNEHCVLPLSCYVDGQYNLNDLYIGVPAIVNREGIAQILELNLNPSEMNKMELSANTLKTILDEAIEKAAL